MADTFIKFYLQIIFKIMNEQLIAIYNKQNISTYDMLLAKEIELNMFKRLCYFLLNYFQKDNSDLIELEKKINAEYDVSLFDLQIAPDNMKSDILNQILQKYEMLINIYISKIALMLSEEFYRKGVFIEYS